MHRIADQSLVALKSLRTSGVRFSLATPADDAEIRRLLRENPMPGAISVSLEREPNAGIFAAIEGHEHYTIIARDESISRLIAMGGIAVRERYVNDEPTRVGYLSQLRLDHRCRPRASVILGGYQYFRQLHESLGIKLFLTSIAADNAPARRLLERGLPAMPTYRPLCDFSTLIFRRRRNSDLSKVTAKVRGDLRRAGFALRHGEPELMPLVAKLLNGEAARSQFAPVWSGAQLDSLCAYGLKPNHFRIVFQDDCPVACAGMWDQRSSRQVVVRRYPTALNVLRTTINLLTPLTKMPLLPKVGRPMALALISHIVTPPDRPEMIEPFIRSLHGSAHSLGVDCLGVGMDVRDPRLAMLKRSFGGREYLTKLYVVHWEDGRVEAEALDDRICYPEVALL